MADGARLDPSLVPVPIAMLNEMRDGMQAMRQESRRARALPETFHLDVSAPGTITRTTRGVLKYIHNPTAAAIQMRLVDSSNKRVLWGGALAPGDQAGVYAVFHGGIECTALTGFPASGDPIVLCGDYDANE